jgi:hypothetical protein
LPAQSGPSDGPRQPSPVDEARFRTMLEHDNCTFSEVEILNDNIGYIKFGAFPDPNICGATVVAAMKFVAHTDALIFDLRENHGGDPSMVDLRFSGHIPFSSLDFCHHPPGSAVRIGVELLPAIIVANLNRRPVMAL